MPAHAWGSRGKSPPKADYICSPCLKSKENYHILMTEEVLGPQHTPRWGVCCVKLTISPLLKEPTQCLLLKAMNNRSWSSVSSLQPLLEAYQDSSDICLFVFLFCFCF